MNKKGFTLIELMVVVVIISLLATIGVPRLTLSIQKAHLDSAKPYLLDIASRLRMYHKEFGTYELVPGNTLFNDENQLTEKLGIDLKDAANFCFVVKTGTPFLSNDAESPEFEVYTYLKVSDDDNTVNGCVPTVDKPVPDSWVAKVDIRMQEDLLTGSTDGIVVALRYPPGENSGLVGRNDWIAGITMSNALMPQ